MISSVLNVPNGQIVVLSDYDVIDVIRDNVSDDVADFVSQRLHELNEERDYEQLKFNTDYESLESSCDAYNSAMNDIWQMSDELIDEIKGADRLNRQKILEKLEAIIEVARQF